MDFEYRRKNIYKQIDGKGVEQIFAYAEGYKNFLLNAKTERFATETAIGLAKSKGFKEYRLGDEIKAGDKLYFNNRGKNLCFIKVGTNNVCEHGFKIMAAHVDSPRLDLKPNPLYEEGGMAFFKTHYYGAIKKYQWLTIPLTLCGVAVLPGGKCVKINVGDGEDDPVFYITDLLPHLAQEQYNKPLHSAVKGESLNALVGSLPETGDGDDKCVKSAILKLLNEKYGITEIDFQTSELSFVPAGKPRDVGFDRSMISSYGHDDKVCAYPIMTALFDSCSKDTLITVFADKEETGSDGVTGMQSEIFKDLLDNISLALGANPARARYASKCISADVTSAFDPEYAEVFEKKNVSYINCGVSVGKYHGSRGKNGTNDASAETLGYLRDAFDGAGVVWQTGELGKIDAGGGGTVAKFISRLGIETCDMGVPLLSMHAPYEVIGKADLYSLYLAAKAFCEK